MDESPVKVGVHQGSPLSLFLFATVIHVVTDEVSKDLFYEILYADDSVLLSNFIEGIRRKFVN